jgi:lysozyme family protein
MAISTYDESLRRLLVHEGGYSNHPSDPGGPTNFGITIHDYRKYVKPDATAADVRAMTVAQAKAIYRGKYWNVMRCDELPAGIDYCLFDYAVNSGTGRAPKVLQRVLGAAVTGRMDDATVRLSHTRAAETLIAAVCDERLQFLQNLRTWPVFGKGWGRRVGEVRAASLAMVDSAVRRTPQTSSSPAPGKGVVPVNEGARKTAAGGALVAGAAAAAQGSDSTTVIFILTGAVALAIGTWLFWRWWQKRQQEAPSKS